MVVKHMLELEGAGLHHHTGDVRSLVHVHAAAGASM